jgi:hypothetical protein
MSYEAPGQSKMRTVNEGDGRGEEDDERVSGSSRRGESTDEKDGDQSLPMSRKESAQRGGEGKLKWTHPEPVSALNTTLEVAAFARACSW